MSKSNSPLSKKTGIPDYLLDAEAISVVEVQKPQPTKSQIMASQLKQYQSLSLRGKVTLSKKKIQQWLDHWEDQCYVAFSGGKDSTVLLDLVWSINPRIPAVFVDTGLEYPEIREFVKGYGDRVIWLKPKMPFNQVIEKYGYPVIGKNQSMAISRCINTKDPVVAEYRQFGTRNGVPSGKAGVIPKKYHYLLDAPFKISEQCCDVMKKRPFKAYDKETGRKPFVGTMTVESNQRMKQYLSEGCQSFDTLSPQSRPLAFWTEQDVLQYIRERVVAICDVYGAMEDGTRVFQRKLPSGLWETCGEQRTGCMFCMFGVHMEKGENRFQRMYRTHPKQWNYCINTLGCGKVLDYIGVDYGKDNSK